MRGAAIQSKTSLTTTTNSSLFYEEDNQVIWQKKNRKIPDFYFLFFDKTNTA